MAAIGLLCFALRAWGGNKYQGDVANKNVTLMISIVEATMMLTIMAVITVQH